MSDDSVVLLKARKMVDRVFKFRDTPATVDYLPVWKANATPEERFLELAAMARKHPERFEQMLLIYNESVDGGKSTVTRYATFNCTTTETYGLLELARQEIQKFTRGE